MNSHELVHKLLELDNVPVGIGKMTLDKIPKYCEIIDFKFWEVHENYKKNCSDYFEWIQLLEHDTLPHIK